MNPHKLNQILAGQTNLARRIYDATPIQEAWHIRDIRRHIPNCTTEHRVIRGALRELQDAGLVRENPPHHFSRTHKPRQAAKPKPAEQPEQQIEQQHQEPTQEASSTMTTQTTQKAEQANIEILAAIASDVFHLAGDIQKRMGAIATRIEEAALKIEHDRELDADKLAKLQQLQTLLKTLGQ